MDFDFTQDIVLEDERVRLQPLALTDFEGLLPVATEDKTLVQFSPSQIHTEEFLRGYIDTALRDREEKIRYAFSVFDKQTGRMAGSTSFGSISNRDKRIEIGWTWYGRSFQRTGLNRHCKFLLMKFVFETLEFQRLEFRTDERNNASRTAIEKIGGKYEGILRSHMLMPDGFRRNTVFYAILMEEWPRIRENVFDGY